MHQRQRGVSITIWGNVPASQRGLGPAGRCVRGAGPAVQPAESSNSSSDTCKQSHTAGAKRLWAHTQNDYGIKRWKVFFCLSSRQKNSLKFFNSQSCGLCKLLIEPSTESGERRPQVMASWFFSHWKPLQIFYLWNWRKKTPLSASAICFTDL